jgi:hypothetical protein
MEAPEIKVSHAKANGTPFQYSLRTMFIMMTVLAIALSGLFAGPLWLTMLTGLFLAITAPMVLTILLVYGRGYARTFCIGALFPAGVILFAVGPGLTYPFFRMEGFGGPPKSETGLVVGIFILGASVVIVVLGLVAVGVRWMIEAPRRRQEREAFLRGQTSRTSGPEASTEPES